MAAAAGGAQARPLQLSVSMKSTSIFTIGVLALVALTPACSKKAEELPPNETKITSAPVDRADRDDQERPVEITGSRPVEEQGGTSTSGSWTDHGAIRGGRDAGVYINADEIPLPAERSSTQRNGKNGSTTLGDGKSGQYTDGKGTYGGKATQGTGKSLPAPRPLEEQR